MVKIEIPDELIEEIQNLIRDGYIQRLYGYESVHDFILQAIEGSMSADKETALIEN